MKYFIFTFFIVTKLIAQEYSIDSMVNKNLSNEYKLLKKEVHFDTDRHLSLGKSFYDKKDFINAEKIFLAILEKGDKTKYEYITAEKHLGDIYKLTKKYNKALIHYNNIKDKIKKDDLVYILNSLGYTYVKIYDSEKALEVLSLAKQINEESGNIFDKGGTLGLIAWVYSFDENEKEQSLKYHKETLEAFIKIGEPRGILTSSANLASTYTIYGKYDKALEYLSKALIIAIDLKDVHSQGMIILNFSEVYFNLHKYEEGLQKVNEAFILFEKINSKHGIGLANYFYGILYLKINNYQKAENHLKESLKNCIEDSNLEYIKKNYYYLYELNLNRNDSSKALDHYKNYIVIKDSINKIKHGKVNQQLKLNLGFKEIEKELINSKSELKILNQNNDISRFKVIILSISIILFLIVSFFIFINIKNRNKTLKLNNEKLN
ncbi:MAG: tetratricopeptide repeat protein, partial [Legionellales bacterium]|nr:tetratricopeptide repeat protein [Legionellales bacterium]